MPVTNVTFEMSGVLLVEFTVQQNQYEGAFADAIKVDSSQVSMHATNIPSSRLAEIAALSVLAVIASRTQEENAGIVQLTFDEFGSVFTDHRPP
jgi:hypothetical protein